jgi:hypothetical protein
MDWFHARDVLCGINEQTEDVLKGFLISKDCSHPDAVWLCSLFETGAPASRHQFVSTLLRHSATDSRAACLCGWLLKRMDVLVRAAQDDAFAQGLLCLNSETRSKWMEKAAQNGDCRGLFWKAMEAEETSFNLAMELYSQASNLGLVCAKVRYGLMLYQDNEFRYVCLVAALEQEKIVTDYVWQTFWER